jgi:hypothetical protein
VANPAGRYRVGSGRETVAADRGKPRSDRRAAIAETAIAGMEGKRRGSVAVIETLQGDAFHEIDGRLGGFSRLEPRAPPPSVSS